MILGQFSNKSAIKIWDLCPAFRGNNYYIIKKFINKLFKTKFFVFLGVGVAQLLILIALASYYCSLMALTLFYLIMSFQQELPWSKCKPEWGDSCLDSAASSDKNLTSIKGSNNWTSSSELYF